MRRLVVSLLASTAFLAQPALADEAETAAADVAADSGADIVVFGQGQTRQVQEVAGEDIQILAPGTSPLRAIEKLPSVNFQSGDAFGNYEWSTRVTIRSFNQQQLGFNFDGIPLGDMSYGNHNGLHISRIVSPENIGSVRVSQGAGAVGTQSTNNLGGTIENFSIDPEARLGVQANATYGSSETKRGFLRVNLGSEEGPRGFVSYGYGTTEKYRGAGKQDQHMINAKAVLPLGDAAIDGWFSYSDRREIDYQDLSRDMIARLGYDWDNTYPDYAYAVLLADIGNNRGETGAPVSNAAAGTVYPNGVKYVDDAYFAGSGLRKDTVGALGFKTPLGEAASLAIKGYYHHNKGMGLWATPYVPSPTGSPISVRTTEYDITRYGAFGSTSFELGFNKLTLGGWYEHNEFNQARRFYALGNRTTPTLDFRKYPKNAFFTQWDFDFTTETLQYNVQDEIKLGDLKINLGWKGFRVTNEAEAIVNTSFPEGKIKAEDWFQPSIGFVYKLADQTEVFGGFTQSVRAFSGSNGGVFGASQTAFDTIRQTLKPESSDTFELGARYNTSRFNGTVGVYLVKFHDRLLSVPSGSQIQGNPSVLQNVGSVRSVGFEAAGDLKLGNGFALYASYSYTDATYRDDVLDGDGALIAAIKGKSVVDTPKHLFRAELNYDNEGAFGRIGANYMTKRYYTYTNDRSVPSRLIVDATIGYRFTDRIELQLNAVNLLDKQYISTVGSGGFSNSDPNDTLMTLLTGAPRQVFATLKAGF